MKKIVLLASVFAFTLGLQAQENVTDSVAKPATHEHHPGDHRPMGRVKRAIQSPEGNAKRITNLMKKELGIDDKQYEKLYKINLQQQQEEFAQRQAGGQPGMGKRPEGMPQHPEGGEGGPMGGAPNGGMMGGPGGGMGHPGGMGHGGPMGGEFSQSTTTKVKTKEQMEKSRQKREKKIAKILGADAYQKWQGVMQAERDKMTKEHEKMMKEKKDEQPHADQK